MPNRMKIHQLMEDQAYASLHSSAQGISEQEEALRRLQEYGKSARGAFLPALSKSLRISLH